MFKIFAGLKGSGKTKNLIEMVNTAQNTTKGGFVCGVLASNYDLTDLFIDSALKICKNDMAGFESFAGKVTPLLAAQNVNFTMTASVEVEKIPASLKEYLA